MTHRIPHGRNGTTTNKKVVFFPAPLFCSSAFYVDDLANNSIGFIFADQGYDVWLGNTRGNHFAMETVTGGRVSSSRDSAFYNFTLVEHGIYDSASQIDYILRVTGARKLSYFGHSQGAASGFALLSKRPEYNEKISSFATLGGFRTFGCNFEDAVLKILWRSMGPFAKTVRMFTEEFGWDTLNGLCRSSWPVCRYILNNVLYGDENHANITRIPIYLEHYPQPTSIKNLIYYTQMQENACSGDNQVYEFDYDERMAAQPREEALDSPALRYGSNQEIYGSPKPPALSTANILVPVKVYYSDGDTLIPPSNQVALIENLPNVVGVYHITDPQFVHGTFAHSPFNMTHIYDVIDFFDEFAD